jgi:hypothetical protein
MLASLVGLQSRIDRGDYFGVKTAAGEQSNYFAAGVLLWMNRSVFTVS